MFTVDGDSDPVLHGTFRDSNGDVKVTFDAKFNKNGFNAVSLRQAPHSDFYVFEYSFCPGVTSTGVPYSGNRK